MGVTLFKTRYCDNAWKLFERRTSKFWMVIKKILEEGVQLVVVICPTPHGEIVPHVVFASWILYVGTCTKLSFYTKKKGHPQSQLEAISPSITTITNELLIERWFNFTDDGLLEVALAASKLTPSVSPELTDILPRSLNLSVAQFHFPESIVWQICWLISLAMAKHEL